MALVTVEFVQARPGFTGVAEATLEPLIDDASALVQVEVTPLLDDTTEADCPHAVKVLVVDMVRRALVNPAGISQETLGDYSRTMGAVGIRDDEVRRLRKAVGYQAGSTIYTGAFLPQQPSERYRPNEDAWDAVNAE